MGLSPFSTLKRVIFLDCLCVQLAQKCSQRPMTATLWRTGLLLFFLRICCCRKEECVLGVVGRPVSLPCLYPELLSYVNFSIEWRRNDEVVLRSVFEKNVNVEKLSANSATMSDEAALAGNFSLELPTVNIPAEPEINYSLFLILEGNPNIALCTVCLRIAASFSHPLLQRQEAEVHGGKTAFLCRSSGGFPEPKVYWLINDTQKPPDGSVRTVAASLPDSLLYNVTSHLMVNISGDSSVSCTIENESMNENLTSISYGAPASPAVGRASEALWIFSTALCVVVGVLVAVGVGYQIHLDRISKRRKREFQKLNKGYKRRSRNKDDMEEIEAMKPEPKETDV